MSAGETLRRAMAHHQRGELGRAESLYRRILAREPGHARANHLLGVLAGQAGDPGSAVELIGRAAQADPAVPEIHFDLGTALSSAGRLEEAVASYGRALALRPDMAEAHFGLGVALRKLGRGGAAVESYGKAVAIRPDHAEAHFNLGNALRELGRLEEAVSSFRRAAELRPDLTTVWNNLANALWDLGRGEEALGAWLRALERDPSALAPRVSFATRARGSTLRGEAGPWPGARALLLACLDSDGVDHQDLVGPALSLLLPGNTATRAGDAPREPEPDGRVRGLLEDELFLGIMERALVCEPAVERIMTGLRRRLLFDEHDRERLPERLVCALALQCYWNEHVYATGPDEEAALAELGADLERVPDAGDTGTRRTLALMACYRSLTATEAAIARAGATVGPGSWRLLLKHHIEDPETERRLAARIPALGVVRDPVSRKVQDQYQAHPYPRWNRTYRVDAQRFQRVLAQQIAPATAPFVADAPAVLVAGAGTCRHALDCALAYADSRVLAVDLSLASLAYGARKAEEAGAGNIRYLQADLLQLGQLDERFDVIESVGVLHHMADPWAGLAILESLLAPGGVMKLGLYSERGRRDVVAARNLIAEWGYPPTPDGMRQCRQRLLALDGGHPAARVTTHVDFYHLSGVRDLLFHVQEHRYNPAEVGHRLAGLGLEVLGVVTAPETAARYLRRFPEDPAARDLARWDELEAEHPDVFREMLQIWVRRSNRGPVPAAGS